MSAQRALLTVLRAHSLLCLALCSQLTPDKAQCQGYKLSSTTRKAILDPFRSTDSPWSEALGAVARGDQGQEGLLPMVTSLSHLDAGLCCIVAGACWEMNDTSSQTHAWTEDAPSFL